MITIICKECNILFNTYPCHVKRGVQFCSNECRSKNKEYRKKMSECKIGHKNWNTGKTWFKKGDERLIGNTYGFKQGHTPWHKGKTNVYDKDTLINWSKKRKGQNACEKHPMWGKHQSEESKIKMSKSHSKYWNLDKYGNFIFKQSIEKRQRVLFRETIQKKVLKRDNYTCKLCGIKGTIMHVDHIQKWSEYVELRFNIDNCRTLCQKCHYKLTFGRDMPEYVKSWGLNLKNIEMVVV